MRCPLFKTRAQKLGVRRFRHRNRYGHTQDCDSFFKSYAQLVGVSLMKNTQVSLVLQARKRKYQARLLADSV